MVKKWKIWKTATFYWAISFHMKHHLLQQNDRWRKTDLSGLPMSPTQTSRFSGRPKRSTVRAQTWRRLEEVSFETKKQTKRWLKTGDPKMIQKKMKKTQLLKSHWNLFPIKRCFFFFEKSGTWWHTARRQRLGRIVASCGPHLLVYGCPTWDILILLCHYVRKVCWNQLL